MNPDAEILIVIDPERYGGFYDVILEWIERELPEYRSWFDVQPLPYLMPDAGRLCSLMVPWLQDPVEHRTPQVYQDVMALTDQCNDLGIGIINRVGNLVRIGKSIGSFIIGSTGLRTPKATRIIHTESFLDDFLGLNFPLFVREEWGHGGRMLRANTPEEARAIPFHKFTKPTAIEIIDLADSAGLFRKYRYLVAGDMGMPQHLQISQNWITRGRFRVIDETTQAEETEYFRTPCSHHACFREARKALGLDFVAFDYSLDASGYPVVWEANPYPTLDIVKKDHRLDYLDESLHRAHAMLVALYFKTAGLAMPEKLEASLRDYPCVQGVRV